MSIKNMIEAVLGILFIAIIYFGSFINPQGFLKFFPTKAEEDIAFKQNWVRYTSGLARTPVYFCGDSGIGQRQSIGVRLECDWRRPSARSGRRIAKAR